MRQQFACSLVSHCQACLDLEHRSLYSRLGRAVAVGRLVGHHRSGTSTIQEIDSNSGAAASVGGLQATVEIGQEVHFGAVEFARCKNTGHFDVGRCCMGVVVAANNDGVDEVCQELVLIGASVLVKQSCRILIADGDIARALG